MEGDRTLRAVERNIWIVLAAMLAAAVFVPPRPAVAFGVLGGGVLAGFSYWSLRRGVWGFVELAAGAGTGSADVRRNARRTLAKLVLRYALLVLLAYVMISRLHLHPWGLLAGASSVVAAVSLEAFRLLVKK